MSLLAMRILSGNIKTSSYIYEKISQYHEQFQKDLTYQKLIEESPHSYDRMLLRHIFNRNTIRLVSSGFCTGACLSGAYYCGNKDPAMIGLYLTLFSTNGYFTYHHIKVHDELLSIEKDFDEK